jgi:hypothetical protein
MKPDDIYSGIQRVWEMLAPAFMQVFAVLLVTAVIVGPSATARWLGHLQFGHVLVPSGQLRKALTFYGVSTLLPVVLVFGVAFLASAFRRTAERIGSFIPGWLSHNTTLGLLTYADEGDLLRLIVEYRLVDKSNGVNQLDEWLDAQTLDDLAKRKNTSASEFFKKRGRYWGRFVFAKFLLSYTLVLFGIWFFIGGGSRGSLALRTLGVLVVICCLAIVALANQVWAYHWYTYHKVRHALAAQLPKRGSVGAIHADDVGKVRRMFNAIRDSDSPPQVWKFYWRPSADIESYRAVLASFCHGRRRRPRGEAVRRTDSTTPPKRGPAHSSPVSQQSDRETRP